MNGEANHNLPHYKGFTRENWQRKIQNLCRNVLFPLISPCGYGNITLWTTGRIVHSLNRIIWNMLRLRWSQRCLWRLLSSGCDACSGFGGNLLSLSSRQENKNRGSRFLQNVAKYCHVVWSDYRQGFGQSGFMDYLQAVRTISDCHTLQITSTHALFQHAVPSVDVSW
jgi:hypothetical protein